MVGMTFVSCLTTGELLVDGSLGCRDACLLKQKDIAIKCLKKLTPRSEHGCFVIGTYCHYYLFKEKILCLTTCNKEYPSKLAMRFLHQISDKFVKMRRTGPVKETLQNFRSTIQQAEKFYTSSAFQINYWSLIACNSDGARLVEICYEEWNLEHSVKYTKEALRFFWKRSEAVELSLVMGQYKAYCLRVAEISYITICSKSYPSELVFEYLKAVKNEFESQCDSREHAKIDGSLRSFGQYMKRIVKLYWDTRFERVKNVGADELRETADLNAAYVEKLQEDFKEVDDEKLKSLDTNISGHESVEMSRPMQPLDDNVQVAHRSRKKNAKEKYFRMDADNGRSFELSQDIYQDLFLHQRQGLKWLWSLHCKGRGAILADDMGLGKTRLVLAYLVGLFHSKLITKALIIVPKTIMEQWELAASKIGLEKICRIYTNAKSHGRGLDYIAEQGGLLITSYPALEKHHEVIMGEIIWDYIFCDEGHRLKNSQAKTSRILNAVQCSHKIVVTGTPVQNNLSEFYALINLCNPDLLGTEVVFREKFSLAIQRGKHRDATSNQKRLAIKVSKELNMLVAPYILRRTKQILRESGRLPDKHEVTIWLKMTPLQVCLYEKFLKIPNYKISGAGLAAAQVARCICNHPLMLKHNEPGEKKGIAAGYVKRLLRLIPVEDDISSSCKIHFMLHLVCGLLKKGHKILIFSQSCLMLKLAEKALVEVLGVAKDKVMRMDGETSQVDRDVMINAFQPEEHRMKNANLKKQADCMYEDPQIFLMTTYVGGVGLNLTNATRVIIMDPAKNPSTDSQSVDRAYRLGQTKGVIVYRLITCGTIEEHTYREQIIKGELSFSVTDNKQCKRSMIKERNRVLIAPGGGFDQSITQVEIQEQFGNGFGPSVCHEIRSLRKHSTVFDVTNHSLLFTLEEDLSFTHEVESSGSKSIPRHKYQKKKAETVIDGQGYALKPLSEDWAGYKGPVHATSARTGLPPIKKSLGSVLSKNRTESAKAPGPLSGLGECSSNSDLRRYTPVPATSAHTRGFPIKKSLVRISSNNKTELAKSPATSACTRGFPIKTSLGSILSNKTESAKAPGPPSGLTECSREGGRQYDPGKKEE